MIFYNYLKQCDITTAIDKLVAKHKESNPEVNVAKQVEGYLGLIIKFLHEKPNNRKEIIYVEKFPNDGVTDGDGCVRVNNHMLDIYFWENDLDICDILGMEVNSVYNLEDTVAFIMWELTFCSFDTENFGNIEE